MIPLSPKRTWFYWVVAGFTALQIPWFFVTVADFLLHPLAPDYFFESPLYRLFLAVVFIPSAIGISLLVIRRAPHNICGLLLLCWAFSLSGDTFRVDMPLASYNVFNLGWVGLWLLPLFFPDGRAFPRTLERIVRILVVAVFAALLFWLLAQPSYMGVPGTQKKIQFQVVPNPLYVPALGAVQGPIFVFEDILFLSILIFIIPSVIARIVKSGLVERQQMKWIGWVFILIVIAIPPVTASGITSRPIDSLNSVEMILRFGWSMIIGLAPFIAIGNAILRHRLYDIDIIIRRTLIYSILSAILGAVFFGGVTVTQAILRSATGQSSDVAVVISTLGIAALFTPLRRQVQAVIDRRFYRTKYDAQKTLEQFSAVMRDEVDAEKLKAALVSTIQETMQPKQIALWIREDK